MFAYPFSSLSSGRAFGGSFSPEPLCGGYDPYAVRQAQRQQARLQALQEQRRRQANQARLWELARQQEARQAYEDARRSATRVPSTRGNGEQDNNAKDKGETVLVQLPDGRWCLVPASWVERLRVKYDDAHRRRQRERSPSTPEQVDVLTANKGSEDRAMSDAQKGGPTVAVPILSSTPGAPQATKPSAPEPQPKPGPTPAADIEAQGVAARLDRLSSIASRLETLRQAHTPLPPASSLVFQTAGRLAYNVAANRSVQEFEHELERILPDLDGVDALGHDGVRAARKALVGQVERELDLLDRYRRESWEVQRQQAQGCHPDVVHEDGTEADEAVAVEMDVADAEMIVTQDGAQEPQPEVRGVQAGAGGGEPEAAEVDGANVDEAGQETGTREPPPTAGQATVSAQADADGLEAMTCEDNVSHEATPAVETGKDGEPEVDDDRMDVDLPPSDAKYPPANPITPSFPSSRLAGAPLATLTLHATPPTTGSLAPASPRFPLVPTPVVDPVAGAPPATATAAQGGTPNANAAATATATATAATLGADDMDEAAWDLVEGEDDDDVLVGSDGTPDLMTADLPEPGPEDQEQGQGQGQGQEEER